MNDFIYVKVDKLPLSECNVLYNNKTSKAIKCPCKSTSIETLTAEEIDSTTVSTGSTFCFNAT